MLKHACAGAHMRLNSWLVSPAWMAAHLTTTGSTGQQTGSADVLVWPPPVAAAESHPALHQLVNAHLARERQHREGGSSIEQAPASTTAPQVSGPLQAAVAELLRGRGIAGAPDQREALTDLRLLDLRPLLSRHGLATSGNKLTVVERVWQALLWERRSLQKEQEARRLEDGLELRQHPPSFNYGFTGEEVAQILVDAKTDDVVVLDVRKQSCGFTDEMVIATARSKLHCQSAAQAVVHKLKERCKEVAPGTAPSVEGLGSSAYDNADWLVVDAGSVVAHVFEEDARREYDIEGLWSGGGEAAALEVA